MVLLAATAGAALRMDVRFSDLLTPFATVVTQSSSALIVDVDSFRFSFTGTGVRYNSAVEPTSGTITSFTWSQNSTTLFTIGGLNIPAATFFQAIRTFDPDPFALLLPGNDELRGGALSDNLVDYAGHNNFFGGAGSDVINGGDGNDHIYGQSPSGGDDGNDILNGGGGSDYVQGNAGEDRIGGGEGSDRLQGGAGHDKIAGGGGNDTINGNRGNDTIDGWFGNDVLRGGQGDDVIQGFRGNDILFGDLGNDTLWGGGDGDRLTGGAGADVFQIMGQIIGPEALERAADGLPVQLNIITDFIPGEDKIDLIPETGFAPLTVAPDQANVRAALDYAIAHEGRDLMAIGVGSDTYLFYGVREKGDYGFVLVLLETDADELRLGDFGPSGFRFPESQRDVPF